MKLTLDATTLTITLDGLEQLWAAHLGKRIYVPLADLGSVHVQPYGTVDSKGIRAPGTYVPGLIQAGTYYTTRGRELWYVCRQDTELKHTPVLTLGLQAHCYYKRIALSGDDMAAWGDRLQTQLSPSSS